MSGTSHLTGDGTATGLKRDLDWVVMGLGDFDGDGKTDVLTRDSVVGTWHVALMDGKTVTTAGTGNADLTSNLDWGLVAIADFDGDGADDLLLRHATTHRWWLYVMDGRRHAVGASGPVENRSARRRRPARRRALDGRRRRRSRRRRPRRSAAPPRNRTARGATTAWTGAPSPTRAARRWAFPPATAWTFSRVLRIWTATAPTACCFATPRASGGGTSPRSSPPPPTLRPTSRRRPRPGSSRGSGISPATARTTWCCATCPRPPPTPAGGWSGR